MSRTVQTLVAAMSLVFSVTALEWRTNAQTGGAQADLPAGAGKAIVETACLGCHAASVIANGNAQWPATVDRMIAAGASVAPGQRAALIDYLAKNFPARAGLNASLVPGTARVSFREWDVPTRGAFPHDPLAAADGSLWWTGMFANRLGRLDLKTGQLREYPVPDGSGPHGLCEDAEGNIWYTANQRGYIGRLNPRTGDITQYKMPDPAARDPHTPIFDRTGMLWFTVQGANMIGRLNPKTGEIRLVTSLTPRSLPYGIVISSKNVPFVVLFGTNKIASLDPVTMNITEYTLPNQETRPRRVAITSDDVIWYSDYSRGYLGRFDPRTKEAREWRSPGGPDSQPYGITAVRDVIWYSESNVSPNTLVRFDPKTEKFQTWVIPGGGGVVRNMMPNKEGNLYLAESGVGKVAVAVVDQ